MTEDTTENTLHLHILAHWGRNGNSDNTSLKFPLYPLTSIMVSPTLLYSSFSSKTPLSSLYLQNSELPLSISITFSPQLVLNIASFYFLPFGPWLHAPPVPHRKAQLHLTFSSSKHTRRCAGRVRTRLQQWFSERSPWSSIRESWNLTKMEILRTHRTYSVRNCRSRAQWSVSSSPLDVPDVS